MRQAYLITAYKDYESLRELAGILTQTGYCMIHVDAKSKTITDENIKALRRLPRCEAVRRYDIKWGGFAHVRAIVDLMKMALAHEDVAYLHLLTGEDFPLAGPQELDSCFLGQQGGYIYMSYITPDALPQTVTKRYQYVNYFQDKNVKNKFLWALQDLTVRMQKLLGRKRDGIGAFQDGQIYKGLVYISQPAQAAAYVLQYIARDRAFWEDLKRCQVPEEFFFQTIFMNSDEWREKVVDRELRYMDWTRGDGASPCYLTSDDYEAVTKARKDGCMFARKFHPELSKELRDRLRSDIAG